MEKSIVGKVFYTTATVEKCPNGESKFSHFGIIPQLASMWGKKSSDVIHVKCTITHQDVFFENGFVEPYSNPYYGYYSIEDGEVSTSLCWQHRVVYGVCFPYGPDAACWKYVDGQRTEVQRGSTIIFIPEIDTEKHKQMISL